MEFFNPADSGGTSRIKKASSDKVLDDAEVTDRTKGGGGGGGGGGAGDTETTSGGVNGRSNRMSYPTGATKAPLRRKRSSSRLAGILIEV